MKYAFWNIRGLNDPNKQVEVKKFIASNKVDIMAVLETKVKRINNDKIRRRICSSGSWADNSSYAFHGRIWLWWNDQRLNLVVLKAHGQFLHCEIVIDNVSLCCTFVYAYNQIDERIPLWQELLAIGQNMTKPWAVVGDLNTILFQTEKLRNGDYTQVNTSELQEFCQSAAISDLTFSGNLLTWCNQQAGPNRTYCKLDRVLVNDQWIHKFPHSAAVFLNPGISDHSPGLVSVFEDYWGGPRAFKYCDMWIVMLLLIK